MFFVQHQCFWFQKSKLKNTNFWSKGGCNKTGFLCTCVLQNVKSYRFIYPFFGQVWLMFKKHYKNRYFSTFWKAQKTKNAILRCYYLGQVTNLAQIITLSLSWKILQNHEFLGKSCIDQTKSWNFLGNLSNILQKPTNC